MKTTATTAAAQIYQMQRTPRWFHHPRQSPYSTSAAALSATSTANGGGGKPAGGGRYSTSTNGVGAPWSPFLAPAAFTEDDGGPARANATSTGRTVRETPKAQLVFRPTPDGLKLVVD